jgi:hypothetical protein
MLNTQILCILGNLSSYLRYYVYFFNEDVFRIDLNSEVGFGIEGFWIGGSGRIGVGIYCSSFSSSIALITPKILCESKMLSTFLR